MLGQKDRKEWHHMQFAKRGADRFIRLLDHSAGALAEVSSGFGRRQPTCRAHQQPHAERSSNFATDLETDGWLMFRCLAAAVNDPVSTTSTNASMTAGSIHCWPSI
jgi:hypothetical protein